jgi:hypothetical protein
MHILKIKKGFISDKTGITRNLENQKTKIIFAGMA